MPVFDIHELTTPEFWLRLYRSGQFGDEGMENIFIVVIARLLVVILILVTARIAVGLVRRFLSRAISAAATRAHRGQRRLSTLQGLLISSVSYLIYFVSIVFILFTFGATWAGLAPLLGAASVLGLAIGFGAQRLVRDIITGLFILGEGQFDVGEWVTIGTVTGRVEDIGLRITRLRDDQGRQYIIANGDITQVFNASRGLVKLTVDINVKPHGQFHQQLSALQTMIDALLDEKGIRIEIPEERPAILLIGMDAAKLMLRLILWVPALHKEALEDALRRRLFAEFVATTHELTLA